MFIKSVAPFYFMDLSEKETREKIIDQWLTGDADWKEKYICREVNSIKSDSIDISKELVGNR